MDRGYRTSSIWLFSECVIRISFSSEFICKVWPAFWTKGSLWPDDGEIEYAFNKMFLLYLTYDIDSIIEGINLVSQNQMALHTLPGCYHNTTPSNQMGISDPTKVNCSQPSGCVVLELAPNSFGQGFANAGGGVFGVQFDVAGYVLEHHLTIIPNSF